MSSTVYYILTVCVALYCLLVYWYFFFHCFASIFNSVYLQNQEKTAFLCMWQGVSVLTGMFSNASVVYLFIRYFPTPRHILKRSGRHSTKTRIRPNLLILWVAKTTSLLTHYNLIIMVLMSHRRYEEVRLKWQNEAYRKDAK